MPASFDVPLSPKRIWEQANHNSRLTVNRYLAWAVIPQLGFKAEALCEALQEPLDELVENFFRSLAGFMGQEEDLSTLLPDVPGLRPWNPLNLDYIKEKGTADFWLYTLAPKVVAGRKSAISLLKGNDKRRANKEKKRDEANTLINTFKDLSGLKVFGGAKITMQPPGEAVIEIERRGGRGKRRVIGNNRVQQITTVQEIAAYKIDVRIRLWGDITASQLSQVERVMKERGTISQQILWELTNPRGLPRPLIRPFMAYYSKVKAPAIIRAAVRKFSPDLGNVYVSGNRSVGLL